MIEIAGRLVGNAKTHSQAAPVLTIVGEIHGTREAPEAVVWLAHEAIVTGPVRIGLEIPVEELPSIERYLADGDRAALLAAPFWSRADEDGRSSGAMLALLTAVRALRGAGADIDVFLFDAYTHFDGVCNRDEKMAQRVLAIARATPTAALFVLCGNLHARTVRGGPWEANDYPWMASVLTRHVPIVSLNCSYRGGTAWCRMGDDESGRAHPLRGAADRGVARHVIRYVTRDADGYDGELYLGEVHASPPARLAR